MTENSNKNEGTTFYIKRRTDPNGKDTTTSVYILPAMNMINRKGEIKLKARGGNIKASIDLAEALRNNFNAMLKNVTIGTESFKKEGRELHVSAIEITLSKEIIPTM